MPHRAENQLQARAPEATESGTSPEWEALGTAARDLIRSTGLPLREVAKQAYLSKSTLWDLANGKRKRAPSLDTLKRLHDLACSKAELNEIIPWADLVELWRALLPTSRQHAAPCSSCGTVPPAHSPNKAGTSSSTHDPGKPAGVMSENVVPVPPRRGDRHNRKASSPAWPAVHDLARYIDSGDWERVNGLVRHAGLDTPPSETATAIASARQLALHDAAETIISYAGSRSEGDVLRILHSLKRQGQADDADALLEHAVVNSRPLATENIT
ncbi:helix-turn-helix transcriptional regulator [Nocardia sp. NPDC051832]|uniref:helix-turn-helix domain-containing protein n=1 Tax=Nocardia sp. NPDC051832 TaxID=3155673 RepID=UPI00341AB81D